MKRSLFGLALQANRSNRHQPSLETLMGEHMNRTSIEPDHTRSLDSTLQKALEMQNADFVLTDVTQFDDKIINPQTGQDANMFISTSFSNSKVGTYNGNDVIYLNADDDAKEVWSEYHTVTDTRGGDDKVYGSAMNDSVSLGGGDDWAIGNKGDDRLVGDSGNDFLDGGEDHDILEGGEGADVLIGGSGVDQLFGGSDADTFMTELTGDSMDRDCIMDFDYGDKLTLTQNGQLAQWGDWVVTEWWTGVAILDSKNMEIAAFINSVSVEDLLFTNGHTVQMQLS